MMRIAFVDTEYAWPPPGGAQVDLYHVMKELTRLGYEVHLFASPDARAWQFAGIDPARFDLPFTELRLGAKPFDMAHASQAYAAAIRAWKPDVLFLAFGFYLKPFLAAALQDIPTISRYYTYENLCIRDFFLFLGEDTCPYDYLSHPNTCRRCLVHTWRHGIRNGGLSEFTQEFLHVGGMDQAFYDFNINHIRQLDAMIVSNPIAKGRLDPYNDHVFVVPGGVTISDYHHTQAPVKGASERKIILLSGRADDPMKGLRILVKAGEILAKERNDFEIWATSADPEMKRPWVKLLGWCDQAAMREIYTACDICVVPSIWDEPFGLVAVEAMAAGRPVVASRVGGLQHVPVEEETGLLFTRKNEFELATCLRRLLDDDALRRRMGDAGRMRAEADFDWRVVVEKHYPPIFKAITS